jgi:glycosyltransferase involved in cell wall biosynthesis
MVVATGNPFASFAAAWWLHRLTGLPYALDYRDSWTFNQFTEQPKYPDDHPAWGWQRRVLAEASLSVFVNEGLRQWHAERYPEAADRMMVVPNGWEPELLGRAAYPGPVTGRPLRFGYVGTVTEPQPLEQLFEGWRIARKRPELADATLDLYGHLGFFARSVRAITERIPEDEDIGVRYRGPVAKAAIADTYRDIDVLVFMAAGARYVTSGKVFEYMATGKPIVSVHAPDIAATDVLTGHPLWHPIDHLTPHHVADAMTNAAHQARTLTTTQFTTALTHAETYTRDNTLAGLENALRRHVVRRS